LWFRLVCFKSGHVLVLDPTTEPAGVALGPVHDDGSLKFGAGKQLQHLTENAGYSYHGGGGPSRVWGRQEFLTRAATTRQHWRSTL
jgi:hypothetical protein